MKNIIFGFLLFLLPAASWAATSHNVGGTAGWTVPTDPSFYEDWVSNITFVPGDSLVFKWTSVHNVLQVNTRAEYEGCTKSTTGELKEKSPVTIPLTENGTFYFICSIGSHCQLGQKVAVKVGDGKSSSSSPPPPKSLANASSPNPLLLFSSLIFYSISKFFA